VFLLDPFILFFFGIIGGFVLLVVAVFSANEYNKLVERRNAVNKVFSDVEALLKKRYDLIPNLVTAVKQYASHEESVFEEIARLRNQFHATLESIPDQISIEDQIHPVLSRLFVLVENYPELKASDHFLHLQKTLVELEEQISAGRRAYNATVSQYNNLVEMVPSNLIATLFRFSIYPWFRAQSDETTLPAIALAE
jgi:LemA protein